MRMCKKTSSQINMNTDPHMQPSFSFLGPDKRFFMFLVPFVFWKDQCGSAKKQLGKPPKDKQGKNETVMVKKRSP